jgi:hypothetical protein
MKLRFCVVLLTAIAISGAVPSAGQEPTNPLRKTTARRPPKASVDTYQRITDLAQTVATAGEVQQAQFQLEEFATVPIETSLRGGPISGGSMPIELGPGEFIVEGNGKAIPGELMFEGFEGGDCCGGGGCAQCCLIPCPVLSLDNFEFFTGVHGFTGPKNRGQSGSFGFHGGFNWGAPIPCSAGSLGAQIGVNAAFSNFSGGSFTEQDRNQIFVTGGLFRRVDWGLQGGLVVDYQTDRWYTDTDLAQVRGEVSWMFPCTHELGFWFTADTNDDTQISTFSGTTSSVSETWRATNLYAFFYRHRFGGDDGATGRFYAGFSGESDGLIGGDLRLPLNCDWALETGFTYLVPEQAATGSSGGGHEFESWNVGVSLVWYPGCRKAFGNDYYRPLFNVANNGSFMVTR